MSDASTAARTDSKPLRAGLTAFILCIVSLMAVTDMARATPSPAASGTDKPTVVLVHGAFADASSWSGVITRLQRHGYPVIAPANPLRSLSGDADYLASVLAQTPGPLVVVGHSYGGAVITNAAAGNPRVKALVYIDAFIPDVGENVLQLAGEESQLPTSLEFRGFPPFGEGDVDAYIQSESFRAVFAADVPARDADVMAASQRPLALAAASEPTTKTAWSVTPSWAMIGGQDQAITPDAQRFMAHRARSTITEVKASHVSMISHPGAATKIIEQAASATP